MNGICEAKEDWMKKYLNKIKQLIKKFKEASFVQLSIEENMEANGLAKATSAGGAMDNCDRVQYMLSIDILEVQQIGGEENWMTPIVLYLKDERLPEDKHEAKKLRIRAAKYVIIDEVLYKRGFSQPY